MADPSELDAPVVEEVDDGDDAELEPAAAAAPEGEPDAAPDATPAAPLSKSAKKKAKKKAKAAAAAAEAAAAAGPAPAAAPAAAAEPTEAKAAEAEPAEPEPAAAQPAAAEPPAAEGSEERPIPFLTLDDNSQFQLHEEAAQYLRDIKTPIAVVSIAGLYRTGKSFLLNLLLGKQGGFDVGGTVNACTKGLWLWGAPIRLEDRDLTVLFVDSEGLGSTQRSSTQDTRIFSLAILLASFFVYNSRGVIDSNAIDDLSLVINLTNYIRVRSAQDEDSSDLHSFFPSFLWVVRDFTLQLEDDGKRITSRQYLENALRPQNGFSEAVQQKNQVRALLSNFFVNRDCVTLVRPATDEDVLRTLSQQPYENLRPEFRRQVEALKTKLFGSLKPKQMMGKTLNGPMLLSLAEAYVAAMNDGGTPVISTAWDRVISSQCEDAVEAALADYSARMSDDALAERLPMEADELAALHREAKHAAKELFARTAMQDAETVAPYKARMRDAFRERLEQLQLRNHDASQALCDSVVGGLHDAVLERARAQLDSATDDADANGLAHALLDYKSALENMVFEYGEQAKGPAREASLNKFLGQHVMANVVEWGQFITARFREQATRMQSEIEEAKQELSASVGREKAAKEMLEQQKESYDEALQQAGEKLAEEKMRLRESIDDKQNELERTMQLMNQLNATHEAASKREADRLAEANEQIRRLESRLDTTRDTHTEQVRGVNRELLESERSFHKEEKSLLRGQQDLMSTVLGLERKLAEATSEHVKEMFEAQRKWDVERAEMVASHQGEVKLLQDELEEKRAWIADAQAKMVAFQQSQQAKRGGKRGSKAAGGPNKDMCAQQ